MGAGLEWCVLDCVALLLGDNPLPHTHWEWGYSGGELLCACIECQPKVWNQEIVIFS